MSERMENEYTLGIDFGTCFSFPASVINGKPISLLMNEGRGVGIPTLYYWDGEKPLIGDVVMQYMHSSNRIIQDNFVQHIKLDLVNGIGRKKYTEEKISCVDICSSILANIIAVAEHRVEEVSGKMVTFRRAVITIPFIARKNKYGHAEMESILREAVKKPRRDGRPLLEEVKFIYEPVAAALYYAEKTGLKDNEYVMVYDLGGGTCDLALVKKNPKGHRYPYQVINQGRTDNDIGGEIFDKKIAEWLSKNNDISFVKKLGENIANRNKLIFMESVRVAKENLSHKDKEKEDVYWLCDNDSKPSISLTRVDLNKIIDKLVEETVDAAFGLIEVTHKSRRHSLLDSNNKLKENVGVIMVGGTSHIPLIQEKLREKLFGPDSSRKILLIDPHQAIAYGAAIFAESLFREGGTIIGQQAHESYGVRVVDYRGLLQRKVTILRNEITCAEYLPTNKIWRTLYIDSISGGEGIPKVALECYINYITEKEVSFEKARSKNQVSEMPLLRLEFNLDGIDTSNELQVMYCLWLDEGNDICAEGKIIDSTTKEEIPVHIDIHRLKN